MYRAFSLGVKILSSSPASRRFPLRLLCWATANRPSDNNPDWGSAVVQDGAVLAAVEHADGGVLCRSAERGPRPFRQARHLQYRSRRAIHQRQAAAETERDVISPFFEWKYNGRPAGNGWNRSTNNARFGTDYFDRTGTAKSNMFDNKPSETQYFYTDGDSNRRVS
jgi:hypothetical protein